MSNNVRKLLFVVLSVGVALFVTYVLVAPLLKFNTQDSHSCALMLYYNKASMYEAYAIAIVAIAFTVLGYLQYSRFNKFQLTLSIVLLTYSALSFFSHYDSKPENFEARLNDPSFKAICSAHI
jgi:hypothetical protein